ncbi:dihydrodipicolinate synthase family protein [Pedosphaera parvula]|uniref:Dihydrodipicolinate synthetase n=1 Tax=Pedosphaera parvula (strain Ellin514) TaxID=320771 RepID=B9XD04_PEDPL|nr:dihydrodipicolinate synthase family protein [Pedosphaera parvula]EEF62350.1 dihydrodipicolinate synthetase [Pedosphaera parvula Ellin514]
MKSKLTGLIAAPFTPMLEDGSLNLPMIETQANALSASGVQGAFICGTTGEGLSLTTEERLLVAEKWVATAPPQLRVIVHVGHNSLKESCELAAHAEHIGAHAIATMGSNFFRPANVEQLVQYCMEIAAAAPSLPFYFYHMPAMTGINFSMLDFLMTAGNRIPNLAGIKFTHENLMDYSQCVHFEEGRFNILFGRDEILLGSLAMGANGAVGSTYNYIAPVYLQLMTAFNAGDIRTARQHQLFAIEIISIMIRHGGLPAAKAIMKMIGIDCGPVRAPLQNLSAKQKEDLRQELKQAGMFSFLRQSGSTTPLAMA